MAGAGAAIGATIGAAGAGGLSRVRASPGSIRGRFAGGSAAAVVVVSSRDTDTYTLGLYKGCFI